MLAPSEEAELAELAQKYGTPRRWTREYEAGTERNRAWVKKTTRRRGEVILVVPRPGGRVLLHTKDTYPDGVYRLPGGGVNPNEAVEPAARREAYEELGFDVEFARLLGVIENVFVVDGERMSYPSYIFMTAPMSAAPKVMDPDEKISGFDEIPVEELSRVSEQLEALPPAWQPWGKFRAAPHALAREVLRA